MASRVCMKRLGQDYKQLTDNPLVGVSAAPLDSNLLVWHLNFDVELTIAGQKESAILHAILEAPKNYPSAPPNVGFCVPFEYNMGASYTDRKEGPLQGTLVLCLNILGNFAHVHTEWEAQEGEGWSPSMSVETVLVQLQSMLAGLDGNMSIESKRKLVADTKAYQVKAGINRHTYQQPWPPLISQEEFVALQARKAALKVFPKSLRGQAGAFIETLDPSQVGQLSELMTALMSGVSQGQESGKQEELADVEDDTVRCYVSRVHFSEEILGYGVFIDKKQLKTPGDMLSYTSFDQDGIRFSSTKKKFTHFLPAYINKTHRGHQGWRNLMMDKLKELARALPTPRNNQPPIDPILDVLPNLINSMIVEIMRGDRAAAIAFFEALCSFWRTLRYFLFEDPEAQNYRKKALQKMKKFCTTAEGRHKSKVPDVGQFLALFTCLTDKIKETTFVDAYLDESSLRCVMWWLDGAPRQKKAGYVFQKTTVSRDIFMFQMTMCRILIEGNPVTTCERMDASCGKLPKRLENLQNKWKQVQPNIKNWTQYFQYTGASKEYIRSVTMNVDAWCEHLIKHCQTVCGSAYVRNNRRGGGRRNGGGNRYYDGGRRQGGYGRQGGYRRNQNYV